MCLDDDKSCKYSPKPDVFKCIETDENYGKTPKYMKNGSRDDEEVKLFIQWCLII